MMYNQKLVIALKSHGKVLREFKDTVYVPFGSEYSILVKNLNSVRAQLKISVDGKDISDGNAIVVNANSEVELTRFITNGNLTAGNAFKFIERTPGIEQHRGVGMEDGLIRVEFQFEKRLPQYIAPAYPWWKPDPWKYDPWNDPYTPRWYGDKFYCSTHVGNADSATYGAVNMSSTANTLRSTKGTCASNSTYTPTMDSCLADELNDAGITVPGSISDQKFEYVSSFLLEDETHVMVLKLLGEVGQGKRVVSPVTVKAKPRCTTCGTVNKATSSFCCRCGTALEIV